MATDKKQVEIPGRLHSVATEGVVAGANEILDDNKGKNQQEINASVDDSLQENKTNIANEITRATNAENAIKGGSSKSIQNLDSRLSTVEAHDTISMDGGSVVVGTAEDFTNRTTAGDAKIPTVGAILNAADDKPTANSNNLVKSGGVQNELALGAVYDVSAKNPTAGPNNDGKFESLSALLSDNNLNTLIPTSVRRGGMSVKFVQSSDNRYVQYRLMVNTFSTDIEDWAIAEEGVYVKNPEFIYVKTDNENKILWAIRKNGDIFYGEGVPSQVVNYINEKIAGFSLDEYKDIVDFLNGLEEGDKTLQTLLSEKVDKEKGKSLINAEYASTKSTVDNLEFLDVITDSEDKVLEGIKKDGTKVIGGGLNVGGFANINGDIRVLGNMEVSGVSYRAIENSEYLAAWVDQNDKVVFGLRTDGKTYIGNANFFNDIRNNQEAISEIKSYLNNIPSNIDWDALLLITTVENPEFIDAKTDSEGKLLAGRTSDGAAFENIGFSTPKASIDGVTIENIEDIEGRTEIKTDSEGKIISYRDGDCVLHENVGIESKTVSVDTINNDTINTRQINIIGLPNVTKETSIYLEKPKFAEFRFYGTLPTDRSLTRTPTTLNFLYKVNGQILLSAKCTLAIQGHGSANYPKKGYTFEPINVDGDAIDIKWGDMIAVDSFHMKAYYSDRTHSRGIGGAKVWRQMIEQLPYPYNKVNNKALNIAKGQKIDAYCIADAKYSEDGFPFAFYLNDEFYGLYTLKLKKNRKNYGMEKSNKNEIFLDCLGYDVSVGHSGKLDDPFDAGAWDLKNPKLKNYEEGGEITDAGVLANIERLFTFTNNITTMYNQHEDYIVLPHWLCWYIHCELIGDVDKNGNNLELATWDGTHWSILPYDMDVTAGVYGGGPIQVTKSGYVLNPTFYQNFRTVFETEIKTLYSALRKSGCIEINNLYRTYLGQIEAIPRDIYNNEAKKWPNGIWDNNEWPVIEQLYSYLNSRIEYLDSVWLLND